MPLHLSILAPVQLVVLRLSRSYAAWLCWRVSMVHVRTLPRRLSVGCCLHSFPDLVRAPTHHRPVYQLMHWAPKELGARRIQRPRPLWIALRIYLNGIPRESNPMAQVLSGARGGFYVPMKCCDGLEIHALGKRVVTSTRCDRCCLRVTFNHVHEA